MAMLIRSSFLLFLVLCVAATASARGGSKLRSVPKQTKHAFDQSYDEESQQDNNNWETTPHLSQNDNNTVQGCSAKYNETINGLNNELVDLRNNTTSNPTAQKNLTSYEQDRVRVAERERVRCLNTYLPSSGQSLTGHFMLSLPSVLVVLFSTFALF